MKLLALFMFVCVLSVSDLCGQPCTYVYKYALCVCVCVCVCSLGIQAQPRYVLDVGHGAAGASPLSGCWMQPLQILNSQWNW